MAETPFEILVNITAHLTFFQKNSGGIILEKFIVRPQIKLMLENFFRISGIRIGVYDTDEEMSIISDYPHWAPEFENLTFCEKAKLCSGSFMKKCVSCDRKAFFQTRETGKTQIYECHMGFLEAVIPILAGERVECFLMIGQVRKRTLAENGMSEDAAREFSARFRITDSRYSAEDFRHAWGRMPCMDYETFSAYVYFLEICAQKIYSDNYIRRSERSVSGELIRYVRDNLYRNVGIADAARELDMSASHLSHFISKEMRTTFTKYLNDCRIEESKRLLSMTNMNIKNIALSLRYSDPAYFAKQFKKGTGMTCTEYRESLRKQNGEIECNDP